MPSKIFVKNIYIFPTVKSALLLLFYIFAIESPPAFPSLVLGPVYMEVGDPR